jgi:hypothetical protein
VFGREPFHQRRTCVASCGYADDLIIDVKRARIYVTWGSGLVDVFDMKGAVYRQIARIRGLGARASLFVPESDRLPVAV